MRPSAQIASHLMAGVGLAALASTGQLAVPLLIAAGVGVLASLLVDGRRAVQLIPAAAANALIVTALLLALVDYLWISPTLLHVGAHLLVLLMFARLRHGDAREYLQLVVIVFLQMLASAGLTARSTFGLWFVLYLIVMIWVLMHYHLMEEAERSSRGPVAVFPGFGRWALTASAGALVITGALFVALPRMGFGLMAGQPPDVQLVGFSPQVNLGSLGALKRDPTVVLRVSGPAAAEPLLGEPLYLRGAVFDRFDGTAWLSTAATRRPLPADASGRFLVTRPPRGSASYTIRAEPLDGAVLFAPARTAALAGPFAAVFADDRNTFAMPSPAHARMTYEVWQRPTGGDAASGLSADESSAYLAFDGSARLARLAREAAAGPGETAAARAKAIEIFLKRRYTYDLDIPEAVGPPIDDFLFRRRSGFCEHFASAMVLMLRAIDIPARVVNGFFVQEWNEYGQYYLVRQGDAHAWVEAYLPEQGWVRFDPTPSSPPADRPWTGSVQHYLDHLRSGWDRYIVDFGLGDQSDALQQIEGQWQGFRGRIARWTEAATTMVHAVTTHVMRAWPFLLAVAGFFTLAILGVIWSRRRRTARPLPFRVEFYARLLRALAQRGVTKPAYLTPGEFAERDADRSPWGPEIRRVTALYYRVRYGGLDLDADERRTIDTALATIERV